MNQKYLIGAAIIAILYVLFMLSKKYTLVPKVQQKSEPSAIVSDENDKKES